MELLKKSPTARFKGFIAKITDDDLFLLSSSVSYYSTLGLAPFILILLSLASWLGQDMQTQILARLSKTFSPQISTLIKMIFANINEGVQLRSISGVIGGAFLLWTSSMVFLQIRYSLDVIYGFRREEIQRSNWEILEERIFAMVMVFGGAILLMFSFSIATFADALFGVEAVQLGQVKIALLVVNFIFYVIMFTALHYFAPSRKPKVKEAFKIASLSSVFFVIGNLILASYLKGVAAHSVYGAAGTLLVFLVWAYYSAFTLFLSVEVFVFLKKIRLYN